MSSPCGGCPPHCGSCVFSPAANGRASGEVTEVVSKEQYGCVRPDGGAVVISEGQLGMIRGENFHPVSGEGIEFLRKSGNPLAVHC